jgi:hypothetical protein
MPDVLQEHISFIFWIDEYCMEEEGGKQVCDFSEIHGITIQQDCIL